MIFVLNPVLRKLMKQWLFLLRPDSGMLGLLSSNCSLINRYSGFYGAK